MEEYVISLNEVIFTLNLVSVRGKENLNSLLASVQTLERMRSKMLEEMKNAAENK